MIYFIEFSMNPKFLVKETPGVNGNVRGIGNRNRLNLSIFIQMTMNDFADKEFRTPREWVDIVEALIQHCNGDHKDCSLLSRLKGSNITKFSSPGIKVATYI